MRPKRAAIYMRVSTIDQNPDGQKQELKEFVAKRGWGGIEYCDHGQKGAKEHRPALDRMLADVRKRKIDVVVVWAFDRLARSLKQLLDLAAEFESLGVDIVAVKQAIDSSTPAGKFTYAILGAVAELEMQLISARVKAGLAAARKRGTRIGRPPVQVLTAAERQELRQDRKTRNLSYRELATKYRTTVWMAHAVCHGRV